MTSQMTRSGSSASKRSMASWTPPADTTSTWRALRARSITFLTLTLSSTTSTFAISPVLHARRARRHHAPLVHVRGRGEEQTLDAALNRSCHVLYVGPVRGREAEIATLA